MPIENLLDKVENEKYSELKDDMESLVAQKIVDRINGAKEDIQKIANGEELETEPITEDEPVEEPIESEEPVIPAVEETPEE